MTSSGLSACARTKSPACSSTYTRRDSMPAREPEAGQANTRDVNTWVQEQPCARADARADERPHDGRWLDLHPACSFACSQLPRLRPLRICCFRALTVCPRLQSELPGLLLVVARDQRVRLADGKRQVGLHSRARQQDAALADIAAGAGLRAGPTGCALMGRSYAHQPVATRR